MNDPYRVLGIQSDATDDEVKTAYREMARKYHPDNYSDNPLSDLAQQKMQEINEAYDSIIRMRKQGGYSGNAGNGDPSRFRDIRGMITAGRIVDAEMLLDGVPTGSRDAEWYFLKGSVLYKKGWLEDAYQHFSTATRMDPNNMEYRSAMGQMNTNRQTGGYRGGGNPGSRGCSGCDMCSGLMCADCCCECMGGDCISCC